MAATSSAFSSISSDEARGRPGTLKAYYPTKPNAEAHRIDLPGQYMTFNEFTLMYVFTTHWSPFLPSDLMFS
jgi:hypothetical protein